MVSSCSTPNAVISLWAEEASVQQRLHSATQVLLSSIVLGELYSGARKSAPARENLARVDDLATSIPVLACDRGTAWHYGRIRELLRNKGRPIPENDMWIASTAQQYGLTLITRDEHFREVEGISLERW